MVTAHLEWAQCFDEVQTAWPGMGPGGRAATPRFWQQALLEDRDAMIASGMGRGVHDSAERLAELPAGLRAR